MVVRDTTALISASKRMLSAGSDVEAVLSYLRAQGADKLDSIKLLMEIEGLSLGEAKRRVHLSRTWQDLQASHDRLHDGLANALSPGDGDRSGQAP